MLDFGNAEPQRVVGELIPDNTIVPIHLTLRPGGAGEGGWLKRNRDGTCLMLDCEFTVIEGPFARRKFWTLLTVEGETEGQKKAVEISRSRLRAALESALGIDPSDESEAARAARRVTSYEDFNNLRFVALVGVEKQEGYKDKNTFKGAITPDRKKDWARIEQVSRPTRSSSPAPAAQAAAVKAPTGGKPSWAA